MARLGFAERDDLAQWGRTRAAAGDLARLVRRLILETAPVAKIGFAGGEGVTTGDWDGTVRATASTPYVPAGLSLWEVSNEGSPEKKADRDYEKRVTTPDGSPTADAAYVALTSRPWPRRKSWARRRSGDGRWREVEAHGLDDLETWLDGAPITHAWISELLNLQPHGLVTAQTWWQDWSAATDPALTANVVLAGREQSAKSLRDLLAGSGQLITINASSDEEVLAFAAALTVADAGVDGGAQLARMAYVDRVEAWRRLREHPRSLVLVPLNQEVAEAMKTGSVHHVLIPVVGASAADLTLEPIDAQVAAGALKALGLDDERAAEAGQLARLSLLASRRRIAVKRELYQPAWAARPVAQIVRRVILLGRFNARRDGDRAAVAAALGRDFAAASEELEPYLSGADPLLARFGATWSVVSRVDAWLQTRSAVGQEDLEAFHKAALDALSEPDPAYELDRAQRYQAGVLGKVRVHSDDLRQGLATTLTLLGAYGGEVVGGATITASEWTGWIVREVLDRANGDKSGRLWASLGDVLPLIAEAAPAEFLSAVRDGLAGEAPVAKLFEDNDGTTAFMAMSPHGALLWALERVSWSSEHFGQAVDLLARLDEVDPGGSQGNRPQASLMSIFRPWFPQASVSVERRLNALDGMRTRHPAAAWKLMLALVLERNGVAMHMSQPRYRDWRQPQTEVTRAQYWEFIDELFVRVLADAGSDVARLAPLVDGLPTLPPHSRAALFERLDDPEQFESAARVELWAVMRAEAAKNREYAKAAWALPEADVERLEDLVARYQPQTATVRHRWLFDEYLPARPSGTGEHDFEEHEAEIEQLRAEASRELVACDWDDLRAFAQGVRMPYLLGAALARVGADAHERRLLKLLDSDGNADWALSTSYFGQRFRAEGWEWLDTLLAGELTARQKARLLLATHDHPTSWERAGAAGDDVAASFWLEFPPHGLGHDFPYVNEVAAKLLAADRVGAALDLLNLYHRAETNPERAELIARGLELMLERPDQTALEQLAQYGLRNLLEYLERAGFDEVRLASLEWNYLPALGFESAPPTLSRHLAASPDFFVDVICRVYRPGDEDDDEDDDDGEEPEELSAQELAIARNAHHLLMEWRTLPGSDAETVDAAALTTWVERARELLRERERLRVGDLQIGQVLAACPPDPDGSWPCLAVRDLLERLQSPEVERGFENEIFASLGVTTRGVLDGGDLERDHAQRYREQAERFYDRWPRTAAVLNDAADSFERTARRHDDEAERRRTGLD
jgi:hypothetical protein